MQVHTTSKRSFLISAAVMAVAFAGAGAHAATVTRDGYLPYDTTPTALAADGFDATVLATANDGGVNQSPTGEQTPPGSPSGASSATSVGESFTVSSNGTITDFALQGDGAGGTSAAGNVNLTVSFGTVTGGVFTATHTENVGAVSGSSYFNNSAISYYDFKFTTPQPLVDGTEYGVMISADNAQDLLDGGGNSSQNYEGSSTNFYSGGELLTSSVNGALTGTGVGTDDLSFYVGGTVGVPEPASLGLLGLGCVGLLTRRRVR